MQLLRQEAKGSSGHGQESRREHLQRVHAVVSRCDARQRDGRPCSPCRYQGGAPLVDLRGSRGWERVRSQQRETHPGEGGDRRASSEGGQ